jgi:hypothetical protein
VVKHTPFSIVSNLKCAVLFRKHLPELGDHSLRLVLDNVFTPNRNLLKQSLPVTLSPSALGSIISLLHIPDFLLIFFPMHFLVSFLGYLEDYN